jgi:RNA-directed DNA polymerase
VKRKPSQQLGLPLEVEGELFHAKTGAETSAASAKVMERVVERENLVRALKQVSRNGGSPGIDKMTVEALTPYLKEHWPGIRAALIQGTYRPQPVRRHEIPKPSGGVRKLGIPTVLDRFIQQAILQVLQDEWDATFSEHSYGFRPGRKAHQAIAAAQQYLREGYAWVVDIDLEKFFDRVNHDKLMSEVEKRVEDRRVARLIRRYLEAGVLEGDTLSETVEGTPQGGPLSPLLANLLLDELDRELEKRGHRFARYADDCNIYVKSKRAGDRVMAGVSGWLRRKLKLSVNQAKSAVGRPWERKFLGFSFTRRHQRQVSREAMERFKGRIRELTNRHRGCSMKRIADETGRYLRGWKAYFGYAEAKSTLFALDTWVRRRLRCYQWVAWGPSRYRQLRQRGVSKDLAWNTRKSAHGPWRISMSPALGIALPNRYFADLGVPKLSA